MFNLKKKLGDNQTFLFDINTREYNHILVDVVKQLAQDGKVCFVNFNKNFYSLMKLFEKHKVNLSNLFFIDAISSSIKDEDQFLNAVFFNNPRDLTNISMAISRALKSNFDYLVVDSVTSLEIYDDMKLSCKFMSNIVDKVCDTKTKAIFLHPKIMKDENFMNELGIELDKRIEYSDESLNLIKPLGLVVFSLVGVSFLSGGITGMIAGEFYLGSTYVSPYFVALFLILFLTFAHRFSFNPKPFNVPKEFVKLKRDIEKHVKGFFT
jgi:hypothetical protein